MATARSVRPSPLKSPATRAIGPSPHRVQSPGSGRCRRRCPAAPTRRWSPELATARSVRPSPLKSPATRAPGAGPRRVLHLGLEGAVAVAQQHRHVVGPVVGDGQVGAAVAVEVPRHEGVWAMSPPRTSPGAGRCRRRCPATPTRRWSPELATARSVRPSPLKSPATRAIGVVPTAYRTWSWKVPSPLPRQTPTRRSVSRRWRRPGRCGRRR